MNTKIHNLSLGGVTGIIVGFLGIIFIYFIHFILNQYLSASEGVALLPISFFQLLLVAICFIYILFSYILIVLINKKRKKHEVKKWNSNAKQIRRIYLIHLIFGGIILYYILVVGDLKLIIPTSLILYGIASVLANKFTRGATRVLGFLFLLNGVLAFIYPNYSFILWGISFGIYHICYGIIYNNKI
ncbi:hypothetical protein Lupro_05270 [Lutibacter profundi]|uniref:Uncharacterized protein n=1 Tax=Lutibacter profundi TaxID=1622118 RepID=A0A120IE65_9FLAO|nr:hypothetical protein [Lutibacter profundi]AMC10689.1 hypothetical protein Lupro_05270 [Lutibacter profundi]